MTESTENTTPPVPPPVDDLVSTDHTLKIGRTTLAYTATTGRVVLREEVVEDGLSKGFQPKAALGFTAYVARGAGENRPVTFAFNGGPGSSSVWLHLGLLGPRRVDSGDVGAMTRPPYGLLDNPQTLLAHSDLVFIDPMSTGFSRAVEGGKPGEYHGYQRDVESVGEMIRLWVSRHNRWLSPKFLIGESYGTVRASALAEHLQSRHGMYLNGIVLVSSIVDYATIGGRGAEDRGSVNFLPTYAATAWYHGKHGRRGLRTVLTEAEEFASRDYPWLLSRGNRLTANERADAVAKLAHLTGLRPDWVDQADLRLEHVRVFTEMLRDQRLRVGRLDTRFTGPAGDGNAAQFEADPFSDATTGSYTAAWNSYLHAELGYRNDLPYKVSAYSDIAKWSYAEFEGKAVTVADKLARAMRMNPSLKVQVSYGYFDGATPYFAAQDVFAHLALPGGLADNIEHKYYEAGHMMYVHEPSRLQQSADLAAFVDGAR